MTRLTTAIAFLVLLFALPASANKLRAKELYKRGMAEFVLEHWDASIVQFEAGFREDPTDAFLFNIAQAHRKAGRHQDAVRYYRKYLDFNPEASDRADVEKVIADEEAIIAAGPAPAPVTPAPVIVATQQPVQITPIVEAPAAQLPLAGAVAPEVKLEPKPKKRWPIWVGIGAGALVLVGGAVALTVAYTTPDNAAIPPTTAGNINVMLP